MKSAPMALTWAFWQLSLSGLLSVMAMMLLINGVIYSGITIDGGIRLDAAVPAPILHVYSFALTTIAIFAAISQAQGSSQRLFTLPIRIRTLVLVGFANGTIAVVGSYLLIGLCINIVFSAHWPLVKPAFAVAFMFMFSQAIGWIFATSDHPQSNAIASPITMMALSISYLLAQAEGGDVSHDMWLRMTTFDWCLAVVIPIASLLIATTTLTFARRGQALSFATIGRVLRAPFDFRFKDPTHLKSRMAGTLWSEWRMRGMVLPGVMAVMWIFQFVVFLTGWVEWHDALRFIGGPTVAVSLVGGFLGLHIGSAGDRFDVNEFLATRPLSDTELADAKLINTLKSLCWTWVLWVIGLVISVLCLVLVGNGPESLSTLLPEASPEQPRYVLLIWLALAVIGSWTTTSLGVSVVLLRGWLVGTILYVMSVGGMVAFALIHIYPDLTTGFATFGFWFWILLTTCGFPILCVAGFRLKLLSARRILLVGISYVALCGIVYAILQVFPSSSLDQGSYIALLLSTCALPFISLAAVPLAVAWNRHR